MTDLSDLTDRLEERIRTSGDYLIPATTVTETIRASLGRLSEVYGSALTIEGLDLGTETSLDECDFEVLLMGAELQILVSLLAGHFTDFSGMIIPEEAMNERIRQGQKVFEEARDRIRRRLMEKSSDSPHSPLEWDEEFDWSS
jgi:hypothetical protein